jgi:hypothetical protein
MGKDAATQTGAADGKDQPAATEQPSRPIQRMGRMEMLDSIGRHRNKSFNDEQRQAGSTEFVSEDGHELGVKAGEGSEDDDIDHDDVEAEKARERVVREAEEADKRERAAKAPKATSEIDRQLAEDDRVTVIDDPSKMRVRIKVDGEERLVPLADLVRTGQKEAAADRRLQEASDRIREAEAKEASAKKLLEEADTANKAKRERDLKDAQDAKERLKGELKDKARRHAELLYAGETEKAAELYAEMMAPVYERDEVATQAPAVDEDAIARRVIEKVRPAVKQDLKSESALETFASSYPEIVAQPHLAAVADRFYADALKAGKSEADAFKEAGDNTRSWVKGVAKELGMSEARTTTTRRESLNQRKERELDEPAVASGGISLQDNAPESPSARSVIAEMAATRPGARAAAEAARRNGGG